MAPRLRRLFFDFVDPLSYVVHVAVRELEEARRLEVERVGVELRPWPSALVDAADPFWAVRWEAARRAAPEVSFAPPALVPWSAKAHELYVFATERDAGLTVLQALFEAYMHAGRDIGRIDVLVDIARAAGLDRTETKAALDVDRWQERVVEARVTAAGLGLTDVPAIQVQERVVQGFHNLSDLGTLLGGSP